MTGPCDAGRLFLLAAIAMALLAPFGCSDDTEDPLPSDPDSWTVVPEFTLHHPSDTGQLGTPRWSPDGKHLAMSGNGGLFLSSFPPHGTPVEVIEERVYDFAWSPNSRYVAAIEFNTPAVVVFDVRSGSIKSRIVVPDVQILSDLVWTTGGYLAISAPAEARHFFYRADGHAIAVADIADPSCAWWQEHRGPSVYEIWASDRQYPTGRRILGPGQYYFLTSQSPIARKLISYTIEIDSTRVLSQLVDYAGSLLYVFPLNFDDSDWSSDGRFVTGMYVDEIYNQWRSDIVIFDAETLHYSIITNTPDVLESNPSLCVANGRIAYRDDEGIILIARIEAEGDVTTKRFPLSAPEAIQVKDE